MVAAAIRRRRRSPGQQRSALNYANLISGVVAPYLWLRVNEANGAGAVVNYGSLGTGLNGTPSNVNLGQTGQLGAQEAGDWNGTTSYLEIANNATLAGMGNQRWAVLCRPDTLGEGNAGRLFAWGNVGATDHTWACLSSNRMQATMNTATTNAAAITNVNQISDVVGAWAWLFMDFDNADTLGNGRKIRLWKLVGTTLSQLTLATNTAAVGTLDTPTDPLYLGNRSGNDFTYDGLMDEVIAGPGLWTTALMKAIGRASGFTVA